MENKSDIYKVLEFLRLNYEPNEVDLLLEFMQTNFPADFEKHRSDNYDGPNDGEAWSGGIADNH